jgi:hypothetical protein
LFEVVDRVGNVKQRHTGREAHVANASIRPGDQLHINGLRLDGVEWRATDLPSSNIWYRAWSKTAYEEWKDGLERARRAHAALEAAAAADEHGEPRQKRRRLGGRPTAR